MNAELSPARLIAPVWILHAIVPTRTGSQIRTLRVDRPVTIGRSERCNLILPDPTVSNEHAIAAPVPDGLEIRDTQSENGVFVNNRRVDASRLGPGDRVRIGSTVLSCMPAAAAAPCLEGPTAAESSPDFTGDHTVLSVNPVSAPHERRWFDDEGDVQVLDPLQPLPLDDTGHGWLVVAGSVRVFAQVTGVGDVSRTTGRQVLLVSAGEAFFGFDLAGQPLVLLADAEPGTVVRRIGICRWRQLATEPLLRSRIASMVDDWISGLTRALGVRASDVAATQALRAGVGARFNAQDRLASAAGVVWLEVLPQRAALEFVRIASSNRLCLFPVTPDSSLRLLSDECGDTAVTPRGTPELVDRQELWDGVRVFHDTCVRSILLQRRLNIVDDANWIAERDAQRQRARNVAKRVLNAGVNGAVRGFQRPPAAALVLELAAAIHRQSVHDTAPFEERAGTAAAGLGLRLRRITLPDRWWEQDLGPLLGEREGDAVALLPLTARRYACVDPGAEVVDPVPSAAHAALGEAAFAVYRPLPEHVRNVAALLGFAAAGIGRDLRWVAGLAIGIGLLGGVTPFLMGWVIDGAVLEADQVGLVGVVVAIAVAAVVSAAFKFTQDVAALRVQTRIASTVQAAVWDRLLSLPMTFFRRYTAGDLVERAQAVEAIQELVAGASTSAVLGGVSALFLLVQMLAINVQLTLWAVLLTAAFVAVSVASAALQLRYQRRELELRGQVAGLLLNLIAAVSKIRTSGAAPHAFRVWAERFAAQRQIAVKVGLTQNLAAVCGTAYPLAASITLFYAMAAAQARTPGGELPLTTGAFIAFNTAFALFSAAIQALADARLSLLSLIPFYERLAPILTAPSENAGGRLAPPRLRGGITLSHVYFRYDADGPWLIEDLSLTIEPGQFVALVGSSGCGKSTLLRLLLGFEVPTRGSIYYEGRDLRSLDLRLVRQQLGVVLQSSRLMPTDIRRNIVGTASRTEAEIWKAAERAGLAADIRAMPMQMSTYVSEGGTTLSGGQRQRLMIARAIVNEPRLLFLDEATSALDNITQAAVTSSLEEIGATRLVVAHRLSTIVNADVICYLESGSIKEQGTYAELMARGERFARLAERQLDA